MEHKDEYWFVGAEGDDLPNGGEIISKVAAHSQKEACQMALDYGKDCGTITIHKVSIEGKK